MKIAVPVWQGRLSPVLDVAVEVVLFEVEQGQLDEGKVLAFSSDDPWSRAQLLSQQGVEVILCGAVSKALVSALESSGIEVIANLCGPVDLVVAAYCQGQLDGTRFTMPGCCGRRRRFQGRGGDAAGSGRGGGRGGGRGLGRGMGGGRNRRQ